MILSNFKTGLGGGELALALLSDVAFGGGGGRGLLESGGERGEDRAEGLGECDGEQDDDEGVFE